MSEATRYPEGWRVVKFGDVANCVNETTRDPIADGLDHIVGLDHMDSESLPLLRWDLLEDLPDGTSFTRTFRAGQVLFGKRRAYQRKVSIPEFDGVCSSDILVFEVSGPKMLQEFLPYIVQSDGFFEHALGTSAGSLSPRTKWQELAKYEFAMPPVDEQWQIVEVLNAARKVREQMQTVDTSVLRHSLWSELSHSEDPLGKKLKIGDILTLEYGKALKESSRSGGSIPVMGSSGVVGFHHTPLADASQVIVVGRKGSAGALVWVDGPCWPIDTAYYVVMKRADLSLRYVYELLRHINLPRMSAQTAVPGLNRDTVYSVDFFLPGDRERESFLSKTKTLDTVEQRLQQVESNSKQTSTSLARSLMEREI